MLPIQFRKKVFQLFLLMSFCAFLANNALAQSTNSEYPTPVTANTVTGKIEPRDIGDPRLTRHFFTFTGTNGDLNVTIESENLNGDVDVFTVNGLRPLTKVSVFDTGSKFVTTASFYMRKREALLLRVEARTANDNAGSYRISFSGGFEPVANAGPQPVEPKANIPKSKEGTVRVNAVGARIEEPKPPVVEKPAPSKTETAVAKNETKTKPSKTTAPRTNTTKTTTTAKSKTPSVSANTNTSNTNADSANASSTPKKKEDPIKAAEERRRKAAEARAEARAEAERRRKEEAARIAEERKKRQETAEQRGETIAKTNANKARNNNTKSKTNSEDSSSKTSNTPPAPDPMASVRLVVETKDGQRIERRMNEVRRVNVEKGVLVVVFVDGKIERLPMINVARMAIEP